jgi:hypothetical protein
MQQDERSKKDPKKEQRIPNQPQQPPMKRQGTEGEREQYGEKRRPGRSPDQPPKNPGQNVE